MTLENKNLHSKKEQSFNYSTEITEFEGKWNHNSVNSGTNKHNFKNIYDYFKLPEWQNIQLLDDDKRWLANLLFFKSPQDKNELLQEYRVIWSEHLINNNATDMHSTARKKANTWIRETLKNDKLAY